MSGLLPVVRRDRTEGLWDGDDYSEHILPTNFRWVVALDKFTSSSRPRRQARRVRSSRASEKPRVTTL